jgi:hypothetical protein
VLFALDFGVLACQNRPFISPTESLPIYLGRSSRKIRRYAGTPIKAISFTYLHTFIFTITFTSPPRLSIGGIGKVGLDSPRLAFALSAQRGKLEGLNFRLNWKLTNSKGGIASGTRGRRQRRKRHSVPPFPSPWPSPGNWNAECFQKPRRNVNVPHQQTPVARLEQLALGPEVKSQSAKATYYLGIVIFSCAPLFLYSSLAL